MQSQLSLLRAFRRPEGWTTWSDRPLLTIDDEPFCKTGLRPRNFRRIASQGDLVAGLHGGASPADLHVLHHERSWQNFRDPVKRLPLVILYVEIDLRVRIHESPFRDASAERYGLVGLVRDVAAMMSHCGKAEPEKSGDGESKRRSLNHISVSIAERSSCGNRF